VPSCELCGRDMKGRGREMVVEGVSLLLCPDCAARIGGATDHSTPTRRSHPIQTSWTETGKRTAPPRVHRPRITSPRVRPRPRPVAPATLDDMILIEDYAEVIRKARQRAGLTQEQLAQRIGEKYSTLQAIEAGRLKPTKKAIRGLERELKISLLEPIRPVPVKTIKDIESRGPTLGDVVRVKRKKPRQN